MSALLENKTRPRWPPFLLPSFPPPPILCPHLTINSIPLPLPNAHARTHTHKHKYVQFRKIHQIYTIRCLLSSRTRSAAQRLKKTLRFFRAFRAMNVRSLGRRLSTPRRHSTSTRITCRVERELQGGRKEVDDELEMGEFEVQRCIQVNRW